MRRAERREVGEEEEVGQPWALRSCGEAGDGAHTEEELGKSCDVCTDLGEWL